VEKPVYKPIQFIDEEISVHFHQPLEVLKRPRVPDRFEWRGNVFEVVQLIAEGVDFRRKGRAGRNMRPENLRKAIRKGSWGVGRYCFRVKVAGERIFDLYYDRAPKDSADRLGHWYLWRELSVAKT
jgi:hypothetical protein